MRSIIKNKYFIITSIFVIWMLFFDTNSYFFVQRKLNKEIEKYKKQEQYFTTQISLDKEEILKMKRYNQIEKYAREKYYLSKQDEEIYLIEYINK